MGTVWLLDVDGVINASRAGWSRAPRRARVVADGESWTMRWEPELINRIRALHALGAAEVRWATTWCAFADQLERLWNLPVLGRAFTEPINGDVAAKAKAAAALNVIADGHRLIWTDDMEVPASGELYDRLTANGRSLLIAPKPSRGLRPDDMDAIEAFANLT